MSQQRGARGGGAQLSDASSGPSGSGEHVNATASSAPSFAIAVASTSGPPARSGPPIRIYEQLTPYNRRLLFFNREAAKKKGFEHAWVRDGKIFVKRDSEKTTPVIRITGEVDLRNKLGFDVATLQT